MAQKVQTLFVDDLDGSAAEGTVRFGLDGTDYEIDLNTEHAQALRDALARYVSAGRRAAGGARRSARSGRKASANGVNVPRHLPSARPRPLFVARSHGEVGIAEAATGPA